MPRRVPTAATKAVELFKTLNSIALGAEVDDFVLRRIERDARKMMNAAPVDANSVLGAVAALEGRSGDVRKHFKIALQLSGNSAEVYGNYSTAFQRIGEIDQSFEMAKQAFERAPDEPDVLRDAISCALNAGKFREASAFQDRLVKLSANRSEPNEQLATMLGDAVDRGAFREESVQEVLRITHDILKAEGIRRIAYSTLVAETGCTDSFLYKFYIFASSDRAADLNETLAERVAKEPDLMADPGTKFVPMFIGTRVDAGHTQRAV